MANQFTITAQITDIRKEIEGLKRRMDTYENTQKTQTELMHDVSGKINSLIALGKWLLATSTMIAGGLIINYLSHFFH